MDQIIAHVQENLTGYLVGLGCALPIILIFRKHTFPIIGLSLESALYFAIFHVFVSGVVRFFGWFRKESSFQRALGDGSPTTMRSFTTPIMEPWWDKTLYHPDWLMYFEMVCIFLIVVATFKYRPLDVGSKNKYQGKQAAQAAKNRPGQRPGQKPGPKYARRPARRK